MTTSIDIDDYYISFETGLPSMSYKLNEVNANGGIVTGAGNLSGRIVKISRAFTKLDFSGRQNFIDWFTKPSYEVIYLRWNTSSFNGISRVYPMLSGGESFQVRNFNYSKELSFEMIMPDPYFESTTLTSISYNIDTTSLLSTSVTITGGKIFPRFVLNSTSICTDIQLILDNNYGFRLDYSIQAENEAIIYTSNCKLEFYVNSVNTGGLYFSSLSTPFEFLGGVNNFDLIITTTGSSFSIKYYERRL
jgi:hypothetical protein